MKKTVVFIIMGILVLAVVLLLFFRFIPNWKIEDLSKCSTAELRELIPVLKEAIGERFIDNKSVIFDNFQRIMQDNGYTIERSLAYSDLDVPLFTDPNYPNLEMFVLSNTGLSAYVTCDINDEIAIEWIAGIMLAVREAEGNPLQSSDPFGEMLQNVKTWTSFGSMQLERTYEVDNNADGYRYHFYYPIDWGKLVGFVS